MQDSPWVWAVPCGLVVVRRRSAPGGGLWAVRGAVRGSEDPVEDEAHEGLGRHRFDALTGSCGSGGAAGGPDQRHLEQVGRGRDRFGEPVGVGLEHRPQALAEPGGELALPTCPLAMRQS